MKLLYLLINSNFKTRIISKQDGFSLLEMSVVIIIMGVILSTMLPTINQYRQISNSKILEQRLELIMCALAAYAGEHREFPNASPGRKLPHHELGLNIKDIQDTYGNYIIYVADSGGKARVTETSRSQYSHELCCMYKKGALKVNGDDNIPFILIARNIAKYKDPTTIEKGVLSYKGGNLRIPKESIRPIIKYQETPLFMSYYVKHPCVNKPPEALAHRSLAARPKSMDGRSGQIVGGAGLGTDGGLGQTFGGASRIGIVEGLAGSLDGSRGQDSLGADWIPD